jgi:hypothetical protein
METEKPEPAEGENAQAITEEPSKPEAAPPEAPAAPPAAASAAEAESPAKPAEEPAKNEGAEPAKNEGAEPAKEAAAPEAEPGAAKEAEPAKEAEAAGAPEAAKEAEPAKEAEAAKEPEPAAETAPEAEPAKEPEAEHPVIDHLTPDHGPLRGGTRVEISGMRFAEGCLVCIGDAEAETIFKSDTLVVAITPQRASFGFADVRVTNPDGKSEVRVHGFQYDVPPLPEFVKPDTLGVRGGVVRVFGEAFAEGVIVTVGGMPVPVVRKGEDCLELTVPAGEPGPVDITITNPDGQHAELKGKLKLHEGPVIESVSPAVGLPLGGTRVMIAGRNFARGCAVTLFGEMAPQVAFESEKKIAFVAPAHAPGMGAVRVTNPDGLTTVLEDAFEYRAAPPPAVAQVSPERAWVSGGARLLVSGSDFVEGCSAKIGGKDAAAKWKNGGLLEVIVPAGSEVGPTELIVSNPDGQTAAAPFTYERVPAPPKLISVTPSRGPTHGNVTVVFTGDNFDEQTIVRIAEVRTTTKVLSKTEMEVLVPPHVGEGPVAIELVSGDGVAVRSEDVFYYNDRPPPKVTGVAPNQGPMSGNTRVSIEGEGFSQDCYVRIGRERPKSITYKGPQLIEIVTPPCKISGFVDIEVGTNQTGSSVAKNMFRFIALPAPVIDGVSPNRGAVAGGTELSITGKNFHADQIVTIAGKQLKFKVISPDLIETRTPPGTDGQMVDVSVKNPDGKEAVARRAFAYDARYRQ